MEATSYLIHHHANLLFEDKSIERLVLDQIQEARKYVKAGERAVVVLHPDKSVSFAPDRHPEVSGVIRLGETDDITGGLIAGLAYPLVE